jgi:single-strand DNA-binding protein
LRYTPSGSPVIGFSIATNRQWTDKATGEKKEYVDYHDIVFWGKAAEIVNQYVRKGSKILVQGRLQTRSWDDKEGKKRYKTEVVGNDFVVFDKKIEGTEASKPKATHEAKAQEEKPAGENAGGNEEKVDPNDIPF